MSNNAADRYLMFLANGGVKRFTSAGSTVSGSYKGIYFARNSQLTSLTAADISGATRLTSATSFIAGTVLLGNITKVIVKGGALFLQN